MKIIEQKIQGIDGSSATLTGYVIDNSDEIDPERTRPAVLILPGGGFAIVSDRESEPIALQFASAGFQAFVLKYSIVPSSHPTQLLEVAQAMKLIRDNADAWHVNPNAVAILGFSAGGQVAANIATTASDSVEEEHGYNADSVRPNALMLAYPVITAGEWGHKPSFARLIGNVSEKRHEELVEELSMEKHVDAKTPPVFVWQTVTDQVVSVKNSIMFIDACVSAGVSVEAHLFPNGPHGLALASKETAKPGTEANFVQTNVQKWVPLACDWLHRIFEK